MFEKHSKRYVLASREDLVIVLSIFCKSFSVKPNRTTFRTYLGPGRFRFISVPDLGGSVFKSPSGSGYSQSNLAIKIQCLCKFSMIFKAVEFFCLFYLDMDPDP